MNNAFPELQFGNCLRKDTWDISQLWQIMHQIVYQRKIDSRLQIVERSWELHVKRRILNQTIRRLDRSEEKSGSLGGLSKTTYRLALRMTSRASSLPRNVVMLSRPLKRKGRSSCTLHLQAAEYVWQPFEPSRYRNRWVAVSRIRSLFAHCPRLLKNRANAPYCEFQRFTTLRHFYFSPRTFFPLHWEVMIIPKVRYIKESFCEHRFFSIFGIPF